MILRNASRNGGVSGSSPSGPRHRNKYNNPVTALRAWHRELDSSSRLQAERGHRRRRSYLSVAIQHKQIRRRPMKTIVKSPLPVLALEIDEEGTVAQKSMQMRSEERRVGKECRCVGPGDNK